MNKSDHDHLEEVAVLGSMLLWGDEKGAAWPASVLALRPVHFQSKRHEKIYESISELIAERKPIDEVTVGNRIQAKGDAGYLITYVHELAAACPTTVSLDHWAKLVLDSGRRKLIRDEMREAFSSGKQSSAVDQTAMFRNAIKRIEEDGVGFDGLDPIRSRVGSELKALEQEAEPEHGIIVKTGIPKLDRKTKLRPAQLTIIAGRPGMGKSALSGNIAAYCARRVNTPVAIFSLEMDFGSIVRRQLAAAANSSADDLPEMARAGALAEAANRVHSMDMWVDDRPSLKVEDMRQALTVKLPQVELVIVDYLQLTKLDAKLDRHDLRVGAVTKELRALAKDFNCHVIALCQLNRQVESRSPPRPALSDLRDSGNIEEDADHVWLLYRPAYYDNTADKHESEIIIAKQRSGPTGVVKVGFWPEQSKFGEMTDGY